ncbi:MAG: cytochrome c-type biogenesis protein CcmH [Burkholderiaceae bacterium]|nr:cytochrome c-type biogenesis protein CcmH [Burkholderiaceae bacterium]
MRPAGTRPIASRLAATHRLTAAALPWLALAALLTALLLAAGAAHGAAGASGGEATDADLLTTPEQRARYQHLAEELRCLVCQNQTLADSNAELAGDLRRQVETMIIAGRSDDEIKGFLVDRYGDFVLYRPPVQGNTWPLWAGPFALLIVGVLAWWRIQRRSRPASGSQPVAGAPDLERARHLLDD